MGVIFRGGSIASEVFRRASSRWRIAPPRMLRVPTVAMRIAIAVSRVLTAVRSARKRAGGRRTAGSKAARRCRIRASVRPWASVHGASRAFVQKTVSNPVASVSFTLADYFFTHKRIPNLNYYSTSIGTNINARNKTVLTLLPAPPLDRKWRTGGLCQSYCPDLFSCLLDCWWIELMRPRGTKKKQKPIIYNFERNKNSAVWQLLSSHQYRFKIIQQNHCYFTQNLKVHTFMPLIAIFYFWSLHLTL